MKTLSLKQLSGLALAGCALALHNPTPAAANSAHSFPTETPVKHLVVIYLENASFLQLLRDLSGGPQSASRRLAGAAAVLR